MQQPIVALALLLISSACCAQDCKLPKLEHFPSTHPECLFYTGTSAFREERYQDAFASWQQLLDVSPIPIELEYLRTDATNNLGYLFYVGLGVSRAPERAIGLWKSAFAKGHEEAAYHLCHVYADSSQPEYAPELGRSYCLEAVRRYGALRDDERENAKVLQLAKGYLDALPKQ